MTNSKNAQVKRVIDSWLGTENFLLVSILIYAVILIGRLYLASEPPINSTDLMRYLGYGREFWTYGLEIYNYTPRAFVNTPYSNLWPDLQFIYPAVSMLFFAVIAAIWPSLFFARLVLTFIELVNSLLVARITGNKLYGLLYFINPVSIWWVSREGQFEALVILWSLLAIFYLRSHPVRSYVALSLAIQTKYWPGVWLPYFVNKERRLYPILAFVIAFLPSILFFLASDYIFHIFGSQQMASGCNPFLWNIFDDTKSCWTPLWHLSIYALATYGILLVTLAGMVIDRHNLERLLAYAGLLAFTVYYKSVGWAAAWYMPMFLVFALPIERRWIRWTILLLSFAEPIAWAGIFGSPIGWINPEPPVQYIWGYIR